MPKIKPEVQKVLDSLTITKNEVRLPDQVAPALFKQVQKVLQNFGGRYVSGKDKRYIFDGLSEDTIRGRLASEGWEFYPTPPDLVNTMVDIAKIPKDGFVLEPCAGDGSILSAILLEMSDGGLGGEVGYCEINPHFQPHLSGSRAHFLGSSYEDLPNKPIWDAIITNPPFGKSTDHFRQMYELLAPGGRLVAIMPSSIGWKGSKPEKALRAWMKVPEGMSDLFTTNPKEVELNWTRHFWTGESENWGMEVLDKDTFKDCGVNAGTCLVWVQKAKGNVETNPFQTKDQVLKQILGIKTESPAEKIADPIASGNFITIPVDSIVSSPYQPRTDFEGIAELAKDIRAVGLIHKPIVRLHESGGYELVVGERRLRAVKSLSQYEITVELKHLSDAEAMAMTLMENTSRENLKPAEECKVFNQLDEAGHSIQDIAAMFGKPASYISRRIKLSSLIEPARKHLEDGFMGIAHAEELARLSSPDQKKVLDWMMNESFSSEHGDDKNADGKVFYCRAIAEVRNHIRRKLSRHLSKAFWDLSDSSFSCGPACSVCPKNSAANNLLFGDLVGEDAKCMGPDCFSQKSLDMMKRLKNEAVEQGGYEEYSLISIGWDHPKLVKGTKKLNGLSKKVFFILEDDPRNAVCEHKALGIIVSNHMMGDVAKFKPGDKVIYCAVEGKGCPCSAALDESVKKEEDEKRYNPYSTNELDNYRHAVDNVLSHAKEQARKNKFKELQASSRSPIILDLVFQIMLMLEREEYKIADIGGFYEEFSALKKEGKLDWSNEDSFIIGKLLKKKKAELEKIRDLVVPYKFLDEGACALSRATEEEGSKFLSKIYPDEEDKVAGMIPICLEANKEKIEAAKAAAKEACERVWRMECSNHASLIFEGHHKITSGEMTMVEFIGLCESLMSPQKLAIFLEEVAAMVGDIEFEADGLYRCKADNGDLTSLYPKWVPIFEKVMTQASQAIQHERDLTNVHFQSIRHILYYFSQKGESIMERFANKTVEQLDQLALLERDQMFEFVDYEHKYYEAWKGIRFTTEWWEAVLAEWIPEEQESGLAKLIK